MLREVDSFLRAAGRHAVGGGAVPWRFVFSAVCVAGFVYGAAMGSYAGRPLQCVYSGTKVPLLIGVSTLICLPSFFVINSVLGLRDDFAAATRGVLASQGTVALALASLAPLTLVGYLSGVRYSTALVLNGLMFATASLAGQWILARHYRPLLQRDSRHAVCFGAWLLLYWFVAIQMAWVLRPFVGSPHLPPTFFRQEAWGNAYVQVFAALRNALAPR